MGRLDEAAKLKVVELRKAGLSFRKIKAELELENIKVSAQAIYLFLREFQGRPPGRARPLEIGGTSAASQLQARFKSAQEKWNGLHLQNLIRISSQQQQRSDFMTKSPNPSCTNPPGSSGECSSRSSSSSSSQGLGHREENDIQIVSVTSLAQTNQSIVQAPATSIASCSTGAITAALARRRVSPSPTTNSMLAARKRILDKALSHRIKSFQQMASLLRRDQTSEQGAGLRNPVQHPSNTYSTNERAAMKNAPEGLGGTSALCYSVQRPNVSVCTSQPPPPRVGIRLPSQPVASLGPGITNIQLPTPPISHLASHNERNSSSQQTIQESRMRATLQDQIQTLSSEVHSLGVAVKMLVEQQGRLEREQGQQTSIQKQILSALQTMSSKMGCCSTVQQQQKTHSPAVPKSTSFNQDSFTCSQGTYVQCSQSQPNFNSIDALETVEPFKLPELSPTSMNGFATCSSAESLPLIPSPLYQQQNTQTHMSGFTQNYVSAYNQANNQTFAENKLANFSNSCAVRSFQDCNISTEVVLSMNDSVQDQVNSIKVEGP
ncbi:uncharacterized protein [Eucyclogobius newberryi]